jgi:hypothetical protein
MEFDYIYTFRPKDSLKALIAGYRGTTLFFKNPIVWSKKEGGYSHWSANDVLLQIKLLFLVYVTTTLSEYPGSESQEFLNHLFGEPPIDVSLFDKWWVVERSEVLEDFSTAISSVSIEELKRFGKTGSSYVDNWFARLTEMRESGDLPTVKAT